MKKLLIAFILLAAVSCKKNNPPAPSQTAHTVVMKFHSDDPVKVLRHYTYYNGNSFLNLADTVYQSNTTVTYSFPKTSTYRENQMIINDIHLPINGNVYCELYIDGTLVQSDGPQTGSAECDYWIY